MFHDEPSSTILVSDTISVDPTAGALMRLTLSKILQGI
jgi:hypothetical protein